MRWFGHARILRTYVLTVNPIRASLFWRVLVALSAGRRRRSGRLTGRAERDRPANA